MGDIVGGLIGSAVAGAFFLGGAWAWFTHLYRCFTEEQWLFLIAGAIFFPIAIVHGIGIWLGIW